mgnify:CR=1 FL=1
MKKAITSTLATAIMVISLAAAGLAEDKGHSGSGHDSGMGGHGGQSSASGEMSHGSSMKGHGSGGMDHSGHMGEMIHESTVDGYTFAYHLIDIKEKMAAMKGMQGMNITHHMMVYITDPEGKNVADGKAGYLIRNPDGSTQKAMTMGMKGGFGSDVNFDQKGEYKVKTKALVNGKKLMDEFSYRLD